MSTDYQRYEDRILAKIVLQATLENLSPLLIGSGAEEHSDKDVLLWPDGRPYIPASSLAGCLKSFVRQQSGWEGLALHFLGETQSGKLAQPQSHLRLDDLLPEGELASIQKHLSIRDGVRIDPATGTAEEGKKYDYQMVEPGLSFGFRAEITVRASHSKTNPLTQAIQFAREIHATLHHDSFRIGAHTNTGFGRIECQDFSGYLFEFGKETPPDQPSVVDAWMAYCEDGTLGGEKLDFTSSEVTIRDRSFRIQAKFRLKSSLLVSVQGEVHAQGEEKNPADKTPLHYQHAHSRAYVLPGKSIRGALRHRAARILKLTHPADADDMLHQLFGNVDTSQPASSAIKGKLRIEETELEGFEAKKQTRIRIDRFTGGVIRAALFSSAPIWKSPENATKAIQLDLSIRQDLPGKQIRPEEKRLLLLLLKDLWLEDLPIGGEKGIGRGVLTGTEATVWEGGEEKIRFTTKNDKEIDLQPKDLAYLNTLFPEPTPQPEEA